MYLRNKGVRILKFLGKLMLWLVLLLLALLVFVHLTFVQKRITRYLNGFLSTELASRVEIDHIGFSIFGDLSVEGLRVWDPDSNKILSVGKVKVTSNIRDLFSGKYVFGELHLQDVEANLEEREDGLSIQYIIDLFAKTATKDPTVSVTKSVLTLQFNKVLFENIAFKYGSLVNGTDLSVRLGKGVGENITYSTGPDNVKASLISLSDASVNILVFDTAAVSIDTIQTIDSSYFTPDFGIGIGMEFDILEILHSDFALHTNQIQVTPKFDPANLTISEINTRMSRVKMSEDSLRAGVANISAQLPGFKLNKAGGEVLMSRNHLALPILFVETGESELHGAINFDFEIPSATAKVNPAIEANLSANIDPDNFAYFLEDKLLAQLRPLKNVQLTFKGDYAQGIGNLETLSLQTANSDVHAVGSISDVFNIDKLAWNNLIIQANLGSDMRSALTPYMDVKMIPPDVKIDLTSSGNLDKMFIDGKLNSSWGNVTAKGNVIPKNESISMDVALTGNHVQPNHWIDLPWLGQMDFALKAKGSVGEVQDIDVEGVIHSIGIMDERIHDITFDSEIKGTEVIANVDIGDSSYLAQGHVELDYGGPVLIKSQLHMEDFSVGEFVSPDSTLAISGEINSEIKLDDTTIEGYLRGQDVLIHRQSIDYMMDTLSMEVLISPDSSKLDYYTLDGQGHLESNFDLQELPAILQEWSKTIIDSTHQLQLADGTKEMTFDFQLTRPDPLQLLGIDVVRFTSLHIAGDLYQAKHGADLLITAGGFEGQGVSLDTIHAELKIAGDSIRSSMQVTNLLYKTYDLGDLDFSLRSTGDTSKAHLFLLRDSIAFLGLGTRILPTNNGIYFYPDTLLAFGQDYLFDRNNPIYLSDGNVRFDNFHLSQSDMKMTLDGDINAFKLDFTNLDLIQVNQFISPDTAIVTYGHMTGALSYIKDQELKLDAHVDSLSLYNSLPLTITMNAERTNDQVPFQFLLSNASNKIDISGRYFSTTEELEGSIKMDVTELDNFAFLVSDFLSEMKGAIRGDATFKGPLKKPVINGSLTFQEVDLRTANPPFVFNIKDETITLDNSGVFFNDFKFYDKRGHPLTIDGSVTTKDYSAYAYDLKIHADRYTLLSNTGALKEQLTGVLEVSTDITLTGNEKDTYVKADIIIKDTTDLVFIVRNDEIGILESEGIVEFVDPGQLVDSTDLEDSGSFYDSLLNSLPDFNLTCKLVIEDNARLKVITNEQSGDYFIGRGGGTLDMEYDRTGNIHLNGSYAIKEGLYRMSFYDLVKRNFNLVSGSSIVWSGSPKNGDLDIKAVHVVKSNSLGLIGDEIGENEQSVYKRSLDYEVGIVIKGTIEKPLVSFTLDLPEADRVNYPVLATKLDRLKLPEFQSELNKQVFGLLVLGGFLPETSGDAINESVIATTAVSNSINALLASQLNRVASQYIKGVNIDIGIQSYSDYSAPGGKTQTTMDFHLSKSFLDERLSFEVGGDFDINTDQSGSNTGKSYRGDVAIIYDLTGNGDKQLKLFNNESYDIIYQEIRNTGISLIFIREFNKNQTDETKDQ